MKLSNKIVILGMLLSCCSQLSFATHAIPKPSATQIIKLDRIIAIVNNKVITDNQLKAKVLMAKRQMRLSRTPIPPAQQLHDQALKMLIMQTLQLQLAARAGMTITDGQLEDALNSIAERNHTTLAGLHKTITAQGISFKQFRQQIKTQMLISKVQQSAVGREINVSPQEIKSMRQQMNLKRSLKYHLADLLVALPDNPTPKDIATAKAKANKLLTKIRSGQSFKALAAAQSASANSVSGGDLGWKSTAELPTIFVNAIKNHLTNTVVGPIQAPNGFHLLKIIAKKQDTSQQLSDIQIKQMIWQRKFEEDVEIWLQQLRSNAYVKIEH